MNTELISDTVKVAFVMQDDSIIIMSFITDDKHGYTKEATDENIISEMQKMYASLDSYKIPFKSYTIINENEIPVDRTYRNAWRHDGKKFHHDLNHAKEIHKDNLREKRALLLAKLDTDYIRADEMNDKVKKQNIARQKQELRDATVHPSITAATTIEELKLAIPPIFNEF